MYDYKGKDMVNKANTEYIDSWRARDRFLGNGKG